MADALRRGNVRRVAFGLARISESLFYQWLQLGRAEIERIQSGCTCPKRPPKVGDVCPVCERPRLARDQKAERYVRFLEAVEHAEYEAEDIYLGALQTAALAQNKGQYQAAAFWLERRRHRDYGRRDIVKHVGGDRGEPPIRSVGVGVHVVATPGGPSNGGAGATLSLAEKIASLDRLGPSELASLYQEALAEAPEGE